jgi:ribosomal protein L24
MEGHKFKLGDKVKIHAGQHTGRDGHIVGITSQPSGGDIIDVRLDPETWQAAKVTPAEIRHAQ